MSLAAMKIRRYRESDHDVVWSLHNLALQSTGANVGDGRWDDLHRINEVYLHHGGEFFVGIQGRTIVAMGALKRSSSERGQIKRMRVHPEFQRRGFGRAILGRLEATATELGYTKSDLQTTVQQVAAQKLYIQSGYVEVGRTKLGKFDVIQYEKSLR